MKAVIHYSEIALKGKNKQYFVDRLITNIKEKIPFVEHINKKENRILISFPDEKKDAIEQSLKEIFGIAWFAFFNEAKTYNELKQLILKDLERNSDFKKISSFRVLTRRSNKLFEKNSLEISSEISYEIKSKYNKMIDLKNAEFTIYVWVLRDCFYYFFNKIKGLDGLPTGSVGKVLCLFSGGIDSPVAAYLMMKRGCKVDFLHFYAIDDLNYVMNSKIIEQIRSLNRYQLHSKLYLVPYKFFNQKSITIPERYDMILFRRFILKFAEKFAERKGYNALVTGDNLGQVASQTLENLNNVIRDLNILLFQPLIGFNKQEIIDLSKRIDLFELSIKGYKDCCSIISKRPATKTTTQLVLKFEKEINLDEIISKSFEHLTLVKF